MMERYMSVLEASKCWGISTRRIQILCNEHRVQGAVKQSGVWFIPYGAKNQKERDQVSKI